ncbi:helix-turn-helix domain-containing protein [Streptomyces sp. NPDC091027]|uniref:helix-turn-helix domain-containing protein n=1 Tax=Streptomyces sp. NPDC091027 TaxID=3365971 RepID=UPI003813B0FD
MCRQCGNTLSQYNPDSRCASCARAGFPPRVPDRAWRDGDVQRALTAWDFGSVLKIVRRRAGLSQKAVQDLTGLTQSFISDLENNKRQLGGKDSIIDLLTGLGLPQDLSPLLLTPFAAADAQGRAETSDASLPWTAARMVASLETAIGGAMPALTRRGAMAALSGAGLMHFVLQSAIAPTEAIAATCRNGIRVSAPLLDALQATTDALRQADASHGSGTLAGSARTHLKMLLRILKDGNFDERTGRRLAAVTADTAIQTGWYHFDSGAHTAAQAILRGALRAAHASGDPRLRAGALSFLAIHSYSVGDPRDAITASRVARGAVADQDSPLLRAMLLTRQARGHARLREHRQAHDALDEAGALCVGGAGEDDPHWLYWINLGEIQGQAGSCHLDLGRPAEAARAFAAARGSLGSDDIRTRAQFLARAATAQMRAGDADAGCAVGHEVLALASGVRSARLDDNIAAMLAEAGRFGSASAAVELREHGRSVARGRTT